MTDEDYTQCRLRRGLYYTGSLPAECYAKLGFSGNWGFLTGEMIGHGEISTMMAGLSRHSNRYSSCFCTELSLANKTLMHGIATILQLIPLYRTVLSRHGPYARSSSFHYEPLLHLTWRSRYCPIPLVSLSGFNVQICMLCLCNIYRSRRSMYYLAKLLKTFVKPTCS